MIIKKIMALFMIVTNIDHVANSNRFMGTQGLFIRFLMIFSFH